MAIYKTAYYMTAKGTDFAFLVPQVEYVPAGNSLGSVATKIWDDEDVATMNNMFEGGYLRENYQYIFPLTDGNILAMAVMGIRHTSAINMAYTKRKLLAQEKYNE
jgi:hypothetical protein